MDNPYMPDPCCLSEQERLAIDAFVKTCIHESSQKICHTLSEGHFNIDVESISSSHDPEIELSRAFSEIELQLSQVSNKTILSSFRWMSRNIDIEDIRFKKSIIMWYDDTILNINLSHNNVYSVLQFDMAKLYNHFADKQFFTRMAKMVFTNMIIAMFLLVFVVIIRHFQDLTDHVKN